MLVHKDSSPAFIVTVGIHRYIQSLATPMVDYDASTVNPADCNPKLLDLVVKLLGQTDLEPIRFGVCPVTGCGKMSLNRKNEQHNCVDGSRSRFDLSFDQAAHRFRDLPIHIQLRL